MSVRPPVRSPLVEVASPECGSKSSRSTPSETRVLRWGAQLSATEVALAAGRRSEVASPEFGSKSSRSTPSKQGCCEGARSVSATEVRTGCGEKVKSCEPRVWLEVVSEHALGNKWVARGRAALKFSSSDRSAAELEELLRPAVQECCRGARSPKDRGCATEVLAAAVQHGLRGGGWPDARAGWRLEIVSTGCDTSSDVCADAVMSKLEELRTPRRKV